MPDIVSQPVTTRLTRAAIFLVVTLKPDAQGRSMRGDLAALRAVLETSPAEGAVL